MFQGFPHAYRNAPAKIFNKPIMIQELGDELVSQKTGAGLDIINGYRVRKPSRTSYLIPVIEDQNSDPAAGYTVIPVAHGID